MSFLLDNGKICRIHVDDVVVHVTVAENIIAIVPPHLPGELPNS
jgi:hypothetical protein